MDAGTHARLWTNGGDQTRRLRRANRDYLLRPVLFGTGAFHPKTYLLGNASEGVLLVGSGNLTMGGVERGREVFSAFRSTKPDDVGSIRGWRQWMDGIIERLADEEVTYRWLRLRRECGDWLEGDAAGSRFIGTGERSILDQFADGVDGRVDELHVMAPFYDRDALALRLCLIASGLPGSISTLAPERASTVQRSRRSSPASTARRHCSNSTHSSSSTPS